ncbi:MAG: 50S ribosomal protein L11 methyltransferase [Muribaculaceae bacterium]|nr:50S ribosomal protein L11 methyltransferase [Muribaculaceae bacterium]
MQNYIALRVDATPCSDTITDLLAAFLGDIGFESFVPDDKGLIAYIKDDLYDEKAVKEILSDFPVQTEFEYSSEEIKGEDWNSEWEKNYFQPILIDNLVVVHSSFHKNVPAAKFDIIIDPKMAFGTGHHSTTSQMMRHILDADIKDKSVIDMGTGTGILAILAKMRGADEVTGIEIDPFAWQNAVENVRLNNVEVNMLCGDASLLDNLSPADIFLANINRNIITEDIPSYAARLKPRGEMYLSGFYEQDIPIVVKAAAPYGLVHNKTFKDKDWVAIRLVKSN